MIAEFTGVLCESSEAFRLLARGFIGRVTGLDRVAIVLGVSAAVLAGVARAFGLLTVLLGALSACSAC